MRKAIFCFLLVMGLLSTITTGSASSIAFIYSTDSSSANDYKSFLGSAGFSTDLILSSDIATTDFSKYDLIIIGNDISTPLGSQINNSAKPIIGLGEGGYSFFGSLGLKTGYPYGWHGSVNSVIVVDKTQTVFNKPNSIWIPPNNILQLYSSTGSVGIYLPSVPPSVVALGMENGSDGQHYSFTLENSKYVLWGFTASPNSMTPAGKELFVNTVSLFPTSTPTPTPTPTPTLTVIVTPMVTVTSTPTSGLTPTPTTPPSPITGIITISSSPAGASIYLDGSYQDTTPKTLTDITVGSHTITLKLTGYEDWSLTVNVAAGQTSDVSAPLTPMPTPKVTVTSAPRITVTSTPTLGLTPTLTTSPLPTTGSISISSIPTGARIYIDENYRGTTPMTLSIAEGSHTATLKLTGYKDWSQTTNVVAGQTSSVSPELILAQPEPTTPVPTETPPPDLSKLYPYGIVIIAIVLIAITALKRRGSYQKTKPAETKIIKRSKPSVKPKPEPVKETRQPPIPEEHKLHKCSKCGAEVHTADRFCEECGELLRS